VIVLLDTTVLIDALRNKRNRRALLAELAENGHILATSSINLGEVYSGMRPQEKPQTDTSWTASNATLSHRSSHAAPDRSSTNGLKGVGPSPSQIWSLQPPPSNTPSS
jgi:hypothetical protein